MKTLFLFVAALGLLSAPAARAQGKFMTKTGKITFLSSSMLEDIEAKNQEVAAVLDVATGQLAFAVPIKSFVFNRSLMQEHFNENYMESEKYPKATFSGRMAGLTAAELAVPGPHPVQVEGDLTIHGVKRHIQVPGTLELKGSQLLATAAFTVAPADYDIKIPALVRGNIAKIVNVQVALNCAAVATSPAAKSTN